MREQMHTRSKLKSILYERKLAPKKSLGQNFLVNPQTVETLLDKAAPKSSDTIIELGVGLGSMTIPLSNRVAKVIGIEIDSGIVRMHREKDDLPDNVTLIHEDLLKSDFNELAVRSGGALKIIANLPYSISNPLIFKLIAHRKIIDSAVLMLQKEVAQRLIAKPRTKEYGVLSVLLATCATVESLMKVGPEQFHPKPKVDSQVVRINFKKTTLQPEDNYDFALLTAIVKGAFQQRRKTLLNALSSAAINGLPKKTILSVLHNAHIDPKIRPDQLSLDEYITLTCSYMAA